MKGAIGNALIMNIVITFVTLFLLLVVGSMAYTKAIKVRNYLLVEIEKYYKTNGRIPDFRGSEINDWDNTVNSYLGKSGYHISGKKHSCPSKSENKYVIKIDTQIGRYDYCIYQKETTGTNKTYKTFMVIAYMKFDLPIVGNYIRIPITGETKPFINLK